MEEIKELEIKLSDIGWDKSDGKSFNVWGLVDFPPELLEFLIKYHQKASEQNRPLPATKKAPIWTAYDNQIYHMLDNNQPITYLPKISATFKSSFSKYTAIAENIGMKLAVALDMPTSYNYLVAFDPQKHPQIISNYPNSEKIKNLYPYGIVSIDFLQIQNSKSTTPTSETITDSYGKTQKITIEDFIEGDQLITFEDALRKYRITTNNIDGRENLIENWINVVDELAKRELTNVPRERLSKVIEHIHSRIARSFLLKDTILGDCDFTAYNGGVVLNKATQKLRYAPNYDYGESFNGLIQDKLEYDPYYGMTEAQFKALPISVQENILSRGKARNDFTIDKIAKNWASSTSERNFYYVVNNFPKASAEFFQNLENFINTNSINNLINQYTALSCKGTPLLSKEEAEQFSEYLTKRIAHALTLYHENTATTDYDLIQ